MTTKEKLELIYSKICELDESEFNFGQYVTETDGSNCGTVCCIVGWFPKWFPKSGFKWKYDDDELVLDHPDEDNIDGTLVKLLGIDKGDVDYLFFGEENTVHEDLPDLTSTSSLNELKEAWRMYIDMYDNVLKQYEYSLT